MRLFRSLWRRLLGSYPPAGSAHAFVPSQDNVALCGGCGRTLQGGDHDRRGDTTRPFGFHGGG